MLITNILPCTMADVIYRLTFCHLKLITFRSWYIYQFFFFVFDANKFWHTKRFRNWKRKVRWKKMRTFFNKNKFNLAHLTNCLWKMLRLIDATSHFEFTIYMYTKLYIHFSYIYVWGICVRDIKMWQSR